MVGTVLDIALAGCEYSEFSGLGGGGAAHFGADRALHTDADIGVGTGTADAHVEAVIRLFIHQGVILGGTAQHMDLDPLAQQCDRILLDVEQAAVVIGPDDIGFNVFDRVGKNLASGQILDAQRVLAASDGILSPGHQAVVRADLIIADGEVALALGHDILVEQDFFRRIHAAFAAGDDGVILASLEAGVVPVTFAQERHGGIILLDAPGDFGIKLFRGRLGRRQQGIGIGVFDLQHRQHFGILARVVAQPVVIVVADGTVRRGHGMCFLGDYRRFRGFGGHEDTPGKRGEQ